MKKSMRALLSLALCLLMCLSSSALAVQYVTFSDIPGDWNGYAASVVWMNADYTPSSANVFIDTDTMEGGEVADGVFEYMADATHAYNNPGAILAYLYIDTPAEITYVSAFEGNWATKEYMLLNSVATDGIYVELFFPSFNEEGELLNTDRIYLIEYEMDGAWHYECVTFYFRYFLEETRSFLPEKAAAPADETEAVSETPVTAPEADEPVEEEITDEETSYEEIAQEEISDEGIAEETASEEAVSEEILTQDEEFAIGIIGGADGPTSVIVSSPEATGGFEQFFFNFAGGLASGMSEIGNSLTEEITSETAPYQAIETTEEIAVTEEAAPEITQEAVEEVAEEAPYEEEIAEPATNEGSAFGQFFSGVFGR